MTDLADLVLTDVDGGPRLAFTVNECARLLGVSRQTVARMADAGRLTEVDTGTSARLIAAWSLRDLIANHSPVDIPGSPTSPRAIGAGVAAAGDRPSPPGSRRHDLNTNPPRPRSLAAEGRGGPRHRKANR